MPGCWPQRGLCETSSQERPSPPVRSGKHMSRSQKLKKNKYKLLRNCIVNGFTVNFVLLVPNERKPSTNGKIIDT